MLIPIEIKSGQTPAQKYFKGFDYWNRMTKNTPENAYVIYGGDQSLETSGGQFISWREISDFIKNVFKTKFSDT